MDIRELEGKVALVTGGAQGLGAAIARALSEAGATVVIADQNIDRARQVAQELTDGGGIACAWQLNVLNEENAAEVVRLTVREYGRLDALVNNAGTDVTVPVEELTVADWDRIIGVNLRAPFVLSRLAFPVMREQGGGHIVNIVSTAATRAWANAAAYHASKWGLRGLSRALHVEGRQFGIKVTAVIAGGMKTPFILDRFPDTPPENLQDPANVAQTVRFVLSTPAETVIPEVMVIPMRETSWP